MPAPKPAEFRREPWTVSPGASRWTVSPGTSGSASRVCAGG
jgi:hypothetical protein